MANKKVVTIEDVKKVAELCVLELNDQELEHFSKIFTDTLEYIEVLDELKLEDTPETYQVNGLKNVYQGDNNATLSQKAALSNASNVKNSLFCTSAVFDR